MSKLNERYSFAAWNRKVSIAAFLKPKSRVAWRVPDSYSGILVMALMLLMCLRAVYQSDLFSARAANTM